MMTETANRKKDGDRSLLGKRLLELFDQVYVINLPHRTDRKKAVQKQFALIGIDFDDDKVNLFEANRPADRGKWPNIGARGCFFSHLNVLKHAAKAEYGSILILEDDADWSDSFLKLGDTVLDEMADFQWDMLHGGLDVKPEAPRLQVMPPEKEVIQSHFVALKGGTVSRLVAYLTAMAAREAGDPQGGPMHVDGAYNWYRREHPDTKSFIAAPCIAQQRPSRTDIHDLGWSDRVPVVRDLKNNLRTVVHKLRKLRR